MKKNAFLFAGKENRRIFTPVITTKANKMENFNLNDELYLTAYKAQALPSYFTVTAVTAKALQLTNHENKSLWLPKSVIKFDEKYRCYFVADYFRRKLENWQLSRLQA